VHPQPGVSSQLAVDEDLDAFRDMRSWLGDQGLVNRIASCANHVRMIPEFLLVRSHTTFSASLQTMQALRHANYSMPR
jgi:hypothetical protein